MAARARRLQAKQGDNVARVGMEGLAGIGLVDAHVGILRIEPEILHVAQHMALGILRSGAAEMRAQPEEGGCRLAHAPALDRQAAQQQEAAAV